MLAVGMAGFVLRSWLTAAIPDGEPIWILPIQVGTAAAAAAAAAVVMLVRPACTAALLQPSVVLSSHLLIHLSIPCM